MHFTRLLGISFLPITSLAKPVALSLSIVATLSPDAYLGYLSDYRGNLTEADKALKNLKVPYDPDDNDSWEEFYRRHDIAYMGIRNATLAIAYAVFDMRGPRFNNGFNKADTKTITEALGSTFAKINETLIDPITTAREISSLPPCGHRYSSTKIWARIEGTAERWHYDNQNGDPDKDSDFDKATWRNLATVTDAMFSVKAAGNILTGDRIV